MRRNGLGVALRLARIEERQALSRLGVARARTALLEVRLAELEALRARALADLAIAPGTAIAAETLQQHCTRLAGSALASRGVTAKLGTARSEEDSARGALAQRRLRVRVVSNALKRRQARERLHARRREAQRVDESVRAVRARAELDDALA